MTPTLICQSCGSSLEHEDRFCVQCGQTTAQVHWSSSTDAQPGEGVVVLQPNGTFYLVAHNSGGDSVRVQVDTTRLKGLRLVGSAEARVDGHQSAAFEIQHSCDEGIGGAITLRSEDGPRSRPSAPNPNNHWWKTRTERQEMHHADKFVRVVEDHWVVGGSNIIFPPGVRKQYVRVWNDADHSRSFESEVPAGYQITNVTIPIDRRTPDLLAHGDVELAVEALPEQRMKAADREWRAGPDSKVIPIWRLEAISAEAGADVVIAIDFGTRNTGIRARWRHGIIAGKPKGTVDAIGDRDGNARFPTEMALHRSGRTFRWGSDVPKGMLSPDEVRISNLKTLLRVNEEPYRKENARWTNEYLLERYFEQLFVRIDEYFKAADPSLSRDSLSVHYVLTRPVLDANEDDIQGATYERALRLALERCGCEGDKIKFVHEPAAAAYGIAKRRENDLLALSEGTPIAVIDAGGGTTDVALARVSLRDGRVALDIRSTYALHLDAANPALRAVQRFGNNDRHEFGGDVLDYALTYRLLTDTTDLLETEGRPVPPRIEVADAPLLQEEKQRRENELVLSCRTMKEAFARVSTHHLTRSADQPMREHEHFIFANRPEYEGIYLEQSLVGTYLIAPILLTPVQELRERMDQSSFEKQGIRPSQVKHVFYVGGTNIEFYLRQQFQEAFPNSTRMQAEEQDGVDERIAERLNAVVEGAVWCDEALFASSALTLTLDVDGNEKWHHQQGAPLPSENASNLYPFPIRLEPFQDLDATLTATGIGLPQPICIARGFYRNTSDILQEGTLQLRISRERGVTAVLFINNRSYEQWRVALVGAV